MSAVTATLMIAAAMGASPSRAADREADPASVFATVGHSEWCPQGHVRLDLATGRYRVTAPWTWRTCRRPAFRSRIRTGLLPADQLAAVREAYRHALSQGLERRDCRVVINNGGTPVLRITRRGRTIAAPREEGCWSDPALGLHQVLERLFDPRS